MHNRQEEESKQRHYCSRVWRRQEVWSIVGFTNEIDFRSNSRCKCFREEFSRIRFYLLVWGDLVVMRNICQHKCWMNSRWKRDSYKLVERHVRLGRESKPIMICSPNVQGWKLILMLVKLPKKSYFPRYPWPLSSYILIRMLCYINNLAICFYIPPSTVKILIINWIGEVCDRFWQEGDLINAHLSLCNLWDLFTF